MHPVLFEIGFVKIFTYGFLVASGFFVAIQLAVRQAKKEGLDPVKILDLSFYVLIGAIIGARLLYIIVEYKYFLTRPLEVFSFWKGGLVFYGGFFGAALAGWYFMRKHKMPGWKVADISAPSIAIGQVIGRWGCYFAGCCYGVQTDVPWAIIFTDDRSLAPLNIALHPTQIYLSINALLIFSILVWFRKRKSFDGQIFWLYGILYSIGRFITEFYRGDERGFAVEDILSTSQFIGLFALAVSIFMLFKLRTKKPVSA
jgi:phosphatidylglycerol:prolipoprotein diacylglycerol transferase